MEPWLDSLSEDWNSEPRSSSPASSLVRTSSTSLNSIKSSQSRIPHLVKNLRKNGSNNSLTRGKLTHGSSTSKANVVLRERSASSLNIPSSSPGNGLQSKQFSTTPSRRVSNALSDSESSVQHYTIHKDLSSKDTPDWKRRIVDTEDLGSDGFDLFSPSRLEGMFKPSSGPMDEAGDEDSVIEKDSKPWNALMSNAFPVPAPLQHICRTARSLASNKAILEAVNEEDELELDVSAASSEIVQGSLMNSSVQRTISNLPRSKHHRKPSYQHRNALDPRSRTYSGRQEIQNEVISPITASKENTIREQAVKASVDFDPDHLRSRLLETTTDASGRPSSPSSDHDVSYGAADSDASVMLHEQALGDITSHSLPEDLSVGTQDFHSRGGSASHGKTTSSKDASFVLQKSSVLDVVPELHSETQTRDLSPSHDEGIEPVSDENLSSTGSPKISQKHSIEIQTEISSKPAARGSPLKLFGNRDTYTSNKLMRVLTHYERDDSEGQTRNDIVKGDALEEMNLRMSQFGHGDLDGYDFQQPQRDSNNLAQQFRVIVEANVPLDKSFASAPDIGLLAEMVCRAEDSNAEDQRSPKRRRTLQQDEIPIQALEIIRIEDSSLESKLAGKKRKDARAGKGVRQASPETLASRTVLMPKSGSRKTSIEEHPVTAPGHSSKRLTEALAAELENLASDIVSLDRGSRKPSLATKDYMEEANKVMEFIRARAKQKPQLPEIKEPEEPSELDPDAILDLEIEESTKDSFSRPPSRERPIAPRADRRHAQHSPAVANHLRKFQDKEDLDLLSSTFASDAYYPVDNEATEEAAKIALPEPTRLVADQESSPPGIRILNCDESGKKRKHSESSHNHLTLHHDYPTVSTRQTHVSNSSGSSGHKGIIASGTVKIPDQIGTMTFDYSKNLWIKRDASGVITHASAHGFNERFVHQSASEQDPFEDIPDLSIDEQRETTMKKKWNSSNQNHSTMDKAVSEPVAAGNHHYPNSEKLHDKHTTTESPTSPENQPLSNKSQSKASAASKHEERLHEGIPSKDITDPHDQSRQARVVTIAFSSPIASAIPYRQPPSISDEDIDEDDPSMLPLDDDLGFLSTPRKPNEVVSIGSVSEVKQVHRSIVGNVAKHEQYRAMTLNRRPVSRVDEQDEISEPAGLSLVQVAHHASTPASQERRPLILGPSRKETSLLSLTPLSDFTLHQADKVNHPEESYVAERANPRTLRQAHGSQALIEDALVKAITDAEPGELFWERLRRLVLRGSSLSTLHGLKEYCTSLEILDVSQNHIGQLNDLPSSLRTLSISQNFVNGLTSWGHLRNLQNIDVSGNDLENLDGFSDLCHLRTLKASHNRIRNINGIFNLDALTKLDVSVNELTDLDLTNCGLVCLESLDISRNAVVVVRNLHTLGTLTQFNAACNSLKKFHLLSGQKLPSLQQLDLSHNHLQTIDITPYPELRDIVVDGNAVETIQGFAEAYRLEKLSARDQANSGSLVEVVLTTPNECSEIYLAGNSVHADSFLLPSAPHYNLRCLDIAACGIQTLPSGFGDHFPNLRVLNLNFNAIQDLGPVTGAIKLRSLLVVRNRVIKMRRTCLMLSRFPMLATLDLRDNPLTLGFHGPASAATEPSLPYHLLQQSQEPDEKWWRRLDNITWLRRRTMELLLAQCCSSLGKLDGVTFDSREIMQERNEWQRLTACGVLKKAVAEDEGGS